MNDYTEILGNDILIKSLKAAAAHDRINHAYIFDGERGIGKMSAAKAFAKTLNCEEGGPVPCGHCTSCRTFDSGNNPDIFYIEEKKAITVDTVRQKINKEIMTSPFNYRFKVFIIKDAHTMNIQAQNAFLKTLEEPPEYAVFLLLSQNFNALLATILSRCILFRLRPLPQPVLKELLLKRGFEQIEADMMSHYACGVVGRALELHNDEGFKALSELAMQLCLKTETFGLTEMNRKAEELKKEYKDNVPLLLELMYFIYRDALVYKISGRADRLIHSSRKSDIESICGKATSKKLLTACEAIENARRRCSAGADIQFVFEELFYKIATAKALLSR